MSGQIETSVIIKKPKTIGRLRLTLRYLRREAHMEVEISWSKAKNNLSGYLIGGRADTLYFALKYHSADTDAEFAERLFSVM